MVTSVKKILIQRVINVFETGTPQGRYDALVVFADGVGDTRQITFGRSQTTEQSNLKKLLEMYVANRGEFAARFEPFLPVVGVESLADNESFKRLLRKSAREDPVMRATQDIFFDQAYWQPAHRWFEHQGFMLPLSMLVAYDSYIHSGQVHMFLRKRFMEKPPAAGGSEKKWISSYVEIRHQWLKHHSREILRKTVYRTQTLLDEMARGNWRLSAVPIMANGVAVN